MKTILVVRDTDSFSRILTQQGFEIINLPLIETKSLKDLSDFESRLNSKNFDGIFITSRHAAQILADSLHRKNINFAGKIYVLGNRSFDILKDQNINLFFNDTANTAREMLDSIPLTELRNKHFLFISGDKSLRIVPEFLGKMASVEEVIVYQTEKITVEIDKIRAINAKFAAGEIAAACFFSPSGASSFIEQFGAELLHQTLVATIGKMMAEFFEARNLTVDFISSKSNADVFAAELIALLKRD